MSIIKVDINNRVSISGGLRGVSPTWDMWLSEAPIEARQALEAFRAFIKSSGYYGDSAMSIDKERHDGLCWSIDDEKGEEWSFCFSFRGWGDFMAASEEVCKPMAYVDWY